MLISCILDVCTCKWVYHKYDVPRNKAPAFANLMICA